MVSFESVFHDGEGTRFHFSAYKSMAKVLQSKLVEGECYTITGFAVVQNSINYKLTPTKFKGNIFHWTELIHEPYLEFPRFLYEFKPYEEILKYDQVKDLLPVDVIGRLACIPSPSKFVRTDGVEAEILNFDLEDTEGLLLRITLWDAFVGSFMRTYESTRSDENIVIVQFGKLSKYKGVVRVQSRNYLTRLLMNDDIPEIRRFKERLDLSIQNGKCVSHERLSSIAGYDSDNVSGMTLSTMQQLSDCKEGGSFLVRGKVVYIESDGGWHYVACRKCSKKLVKEDQRLFCARCNAYSDDSAYKYRLVVHVADETTMCLFMLWDRECRKIVGKTAAELHDLHTEESNVPDMVHDAFLGNDFLFKITVPVGESRRFSRTHNVVALTADLDSCASVPFSNSEDNVSISLSVLEDSHDAVFTSQKTTPTASQSAVGDNEDTLSVESLKRNLTDAFSSTKEIKKMKQNIKEEKP